MCLAKLAERGADPHRCICVNVNIAWLPGGYLDASTGEIVVQVPDVPGGPLVYVGTVAELPSLRQASSSHETCAT